MFALESFSLVGENYSNSKTVQRACEFLISKQRSDGGWGESYKSCERSAYIEHENTQVVQTCWAVMALMHAEYPYAEPLEKAAKLVMGRQLPVCVFSSSAGLSLTWARIEWFVATRGNRGGVQQDLCNIVSQLQVFVPYLDACSCRRLR